MNSVVNASVGITPQAVGSIPAGVNTTGTTGINIGLSAVDADTAESFRFAFLSAWSSATRTSGYIAIVKAS